MLQYLIIQLCDTATSYCHYENPKTERRLMPLEVLKQGILFAMKENLSVQFVYPDYELPTDYAATIETIDHVKIVPASLNAEGDVVVWNGFADAEGVAFDKEQSYVLRTNKAELFDKFAELGDVLKQVARLNVVLTDVESFTDADFETYKTVLGSLAKVVEDLYVEGLAPQFNLLTDRMMLTEMNNCGAGDTNLTLAPDGKFYVCPAFYLNENGYAVGDLENGFDIKNAQLYKLTHAPLCRNCEAYQCKRCIYLNRKTTLEVNTPSHQQCVLAHLERNAARELLNAIRRHGAFLPDKPEIKEIDYLDPFDVRKEW